MLNPTLDQTWSGESPARTVSGALIEILVASKQSRLNFIAPSYLDILGVIACLDKVGVSIEFGGLRDTCASLHIGRSQPSAAKSDESSLVSGVKCR